MDDSEPKISPLKFTSDLKLNYHNILKKQGFSPNQLQQHRDSQSSTCTEYFKTPVNARIVLGTAASSLLVIGRSRNLFPSALD